MGSPRGHVQKFASDALTTWMSDDDQKVLFGDLIDESSDAKLDVTFIRWSKGERHEFDDPLPYDEVFVVTKGSYTVRTHDKEFTAAAGEVIYLPAGATGVYLSDEDAEVVAVTCPPYRQALREAGLADDLDSMREVTQ